VFFGVLFLIFGFSIPPERTMYAMCLARFSKQSDIPEKVLKALEVKLDEIIKGE
jgi:hypothetical protein